MSQNIHIDALYDQIKRHIYLLNNVILNEIDYIITYLNIYLYN